MLKRKSNKNSYELEITFNNVLVCQKKNLQPYIEIFTQKPENITQQKLGFLAGILEITDTSPDSSYIVNYLVSIIKKEYYRQTKRGAVESFEACLHKANLALAKLAESENINWLGKLNAIVISIEKNNIHLAQTGNAHALFSRNKTLKDIAENTDSNYSPTPLKTFVDIISGRLKKDDELILTTHNLFDIFSLTEIKRSLLNFSPSNFLQFLKTALTNELTQSAVLIIRTQEKKVKIAPVTRKKTTLNAFSRNSFYQNNQKELPKNKSANKKKKAPISSDEQSIIKELKEDIEKKTGNFVDKKTGDIYIKEDTTTPKNNFSLTQFLIPLSERITNLNLPNKITSFKLFVQEKSHQSKQTILNQKKTLSHQLSKTNKRIVPLIHSLFSFSLIYIQKIFHRLLKMIFVQKRSLSTNIFSNFFRLKKSFIHLNRRQKYWAIFIVIALIIIPYFLAKIPLENKHSHSSSSKKISSTLPPLYRDKNVVRIKKTQSITLQDNVLQLINLNKHIFAIHSTSITDIANQKSYPLPPNFGKVTLACSMNDLNYIFLLNQSKNILNWSPVSKKFQTNQINFPPQSNISNLKSYLTYLYFLDKNNNQIYRYPRATGGFGKKFNWLKDNLNLNTTLAMAVNENIFLAQKDKIIRLFRGKKQAFSLEKTATPIEIDKIYLPDNNQYLYLLDKTHARIIKLNLNGQIISQYYNSDLRQAVNFTVSEKDQIIYFTLANKIIDFKI